MGGQVSEPYQFKPHERPAMLGSPFAPDHPRARMWAYAGIGLLAGVTGGLGNALITANLGYVQGSLGLSTVQAAWFSPVYVTTNVCANLLLVKFRQQFGLQQFLLWVLASYALVTAAHLFVHEFWSALLIRAASGIAASGLTTLCILALMQGLPGPKRLLGVIIGIGVPQLAVPIARSIAPALLEWGDWRMTYYFELGLALFALAAVMALPLPPSEREKVFEKSDFLTVALIFPGIALLCAALGLGRTVWWTEAPWVGWALIGAASLITAALMFEHQREKPLLATRWLGRREVVRIALIAISVRILFSEQTFGSIGLLSALGMGTDQFAPLYGIVCLASVAGIAAGALSFRPERPGRAIPIACLLIAIGAFMDTDATNLTRPANLYLSQALIGFGALLFIGPTMIIGISRMLLSGPQNFVSWVVLFGATQNLGGLIGSAVFGTFQTVREKFHSHELVQQIVLTNPLDAQRLADSGRRLGAVIGDPMLRSAEGAALLSQQVSREANILAYNDVFLVIGLLAGLAFVWGIAFQLQLIRRGEPSPVVLLGRRLAAMAAPAAVK